MWMWLNGTFARAEGTDRLSPLDRGFALADGVFETIRAHGEEPIWLIDHIARLRRGADVLQIPTRFDDATIGMAIRELLGRERRPRSAVRVTLTRGPSPGRALWPPREPVTPTVVITVADFSPPPPDQHVIVARGTRRNEHSPCSQIKSLGYTDNLLARREAVQRGATDALMLNGKGRIACATVGNIFVETHGKWTTAPLSEGVLPGLARARLIDLLQATESVIPETLLQSAERAIICNSLGCASVLSIEGRELAASKREIDVSAIYH